MISTTAESFQNLYTKLPIKYRSRFAKVVDDNKISFTLFSLDKTPLVYNVCLVIGYQQKRIHE